jgi:acyl dehydratase
MTREWKPGDTLEKVTLPLTLRRAVQAVAGTRDYYPVHHNPEAARENGVETAFFNTMFLQGLGNRIATDNLGCDAFPRRLELRMRTPNYLGRTLTVEGTVTAVREENGSRTVDLDLHLSTEDGDTGQILMTVQLPPEANPSLLYKA